MAQPKTTTIAAKPAKTEEPEARAAFDWNAVVDRAKDMRTQLPRLGLEAGGPPANVEFVQEQPYEIKYTDKKTQEEKSFPVIDVIDLATRVTKSMPVSAVSLQNALGKLFANHGTLKGVQVQIRLETYDHPKYGKGTERYVVSEIVAVPTQPAA